MRHIWPRKRALTVSEGSDLASTLVRRAVGRHDYKKEDLIIIRKSFYGTGFAFISAKICGVQLAPYYHHPCLDDPDLRTAY